MYDQVQSLMNSPTYRRSLADRLEAERESKNNGTIPGGLASMLDAGTAAYLRIKDEGDQSRASDALSKGMVEETQVNTADGMQPNGPRIAPGLAGARERLSALGDNPYAGRLSQMLTFQEMEAKQRAAELADQRGWQTQQMESGQNFQRDMFGRQSAQQQAMQERLFNQQRSMPPPTQRRIVQGVDGRAYYADTGEPVLPNEGPAPMKAPTVRTVKQPDGSEVAVQWDQGTGTWQPMNAPEGGLRPEDKRRKLTETQSKLTLFQSNMAEVAPLIDSMENFYDPTSLADAAARDLAPGLIENFLKSPEGQQYQTLAGQWAEGALRIATGAAATQPEIERNVKTYFPQPGDTPDTVALKSQMRAAYQRSIQAALGGSPDGRIEPPASFAAKFAAQNRAKGIAPQPSQPGIGGISPMDVPPAGSGVDPETWKFLTPEQRKLWQ